MPSLTAGSNSYVTLAEADAYLAGSVRAAAAWATLTDDEKGLALISAARALEREAWAGEKSAVQSASALVISAQGLGYAPGDLVRVDGAGAVGTKAVLEVLTAGGAGELLTARFVHVGFYSTAPTFPAATAALSGAGAGAVVSFTPVEQLMAWPRDLTGCPEHATQSTTEVPADLKAAQCELAWIFSQDAAQEGNVGASAGGTGSNIKKVEAGSAKVTYFRPTTGTPYPTIAWQLLKSYRDGACGDSSPIGGAAYGTGDLSAFTCPDERYGLNRGYA